MWWRVNQQTGLSTAGRVAELGTRPLRMFAPFMALGAIVFAVVAVWLLSQSGGGVVTFAAGRPGAAITIPAAATDPLVIYGTTSTGQSPPDVPCKLMTATGAFVAMDLGPAVTSKGLLLHPLGQITSGWRTGDSVTCSGTGLETVTIGHDSGSRPLLAGLLTGFVAVGSGSMALLGFASRRRTRRRTPRTL